MTAVDPEGNPLDYDPELDDPRSNGTPVPNVPDDGQGDGSDDVPAVPPLLDEAFWSARPVHGHIRAVARARGAAPDAVLLAALAHLALRVPPRFTLPALVGGPGSINLCAALIGPSGAGKGAAMRCAEDLFPDLPSGAGVGPLGTGAGMVDVYYAKGSGDPVRSKAGWLFQADEGQVLTKLSEGQGSVTLEYVRQGWSGERIGAQTVSAPWRLLSAGQYRMCVLLGLQPSIARPLLADVDGGTPQRFVFTGVVDPGAPLARPVDPGGVAWDCPEPPREIGVAAPIRAEIVARRHEVLTGRCTPDTYDSHRQQNRLKVAALLALLEQRTDVTVDDWHLAGMILDTSDAVRAQTLAAHRAAEALDEAGRVNRAAARARAEEAARRRDTDDVVRVARVIDRSLARNGPTTRGRLRTAVQSGPDRDRFDEALAHAEAQGWVERDDHGQYRSTDA